MKVAKFEKVSYKEWKRSYGAIIGEDDPEIESSYEGIKLPTRATRGSAGYDFFAPIDISLVPESHIHHNFPTGIRCCIQDGYFLQLIPKSGLGTKYGFSFRNTTGIIDSDYYHSDNEGHIHFCPKVSKELQLSAGVKIFQGIFLPYYLAEEEEVIGKRNGGHGSTGV